MRHTKTLIIALAIFLAVGGIVYFYTKQAEPVPMHPPANPLVSAPTPVSSPLSDMHLYANASRGFSFSYPDHLLILDEKKKMRISGYIPACDPRTAVACAVIPPQAYAGKNFDSAGFAVNILPHAKIERACLAVSGNQQAAGEISLNGINYHVYTDGDAAMSHRSEGKDYRIFRNGTCFQLTTRINTTVFEVYQTGLIKKFTDQDRAAVEAKLKAIVDSFKFQ